MLFLELASSWLFWFIAFPLLLIYLCWEIESRGEAAFATVVLVMILGLLQLFTDIKPLSYISANPFESLWLAMAYVAVGVGYVWIKWYSFVHAKARTRRQDIADGKRFVDTAPPQVSKYKEKIFGWMFYWPVSAAWTMLNDPIRRIFNAIYDRISGGLQKISDKAFADFQNTDTK